MQSYNYIVDPNYTFGSYNRQGFSNYNLRYQLEFHELMVDVTLENRLIKDRFMLNLLDENILTHKELDTYMGELDTLIGSMEAFNNCTNEEVCQQVHNLRIQHLGSQKLMAYKAYRCEQLKKEFHKDFCKEKGRIINQYKQYKGLLDTCKAVLILPGNYTNVLALLDAIQTYLNRDKKIFIVLKEQAHTPLCSQDDKECLLGYDHEAGLLSNPNITYLYDRTPAYGYNLNHLELNEHLQEYVESNQVFIHGFDEWVLLGIKDLNCPSIIDVTISNFYSKCVTNLEVGQSGRIFIPAHYNILEYVPIVEISRLNYFQLSCLEEDFGVSVYDEDVDSLRSQYPGYFINQYSRGNKKDSPLKDMIKADDCLKDYNNYYKKRRESLERNLNTTYENVEYLSKYFELSNFEEVPLLAECQEETNNLLVDGICMKSTDQARIILSEGKEPCSPRVVLEESLAKDKLYFISNFLFFLTSKIVAHYNRMRKDRPKEQIDLKTGHLDYRRYSSGDKRTETFPLYGKPSIYRMKNGKIGFSNFTLGAGEIYINQHKFAWGEEDVNSHKNMEDVIVYTPNGVKDRPETHLDFKKRVGANRFNMVIINDQVMALRHGDVLLSPLGTVVSLHARVAKPWLKQLGLQADEAGYYKVDTLEMTLRLKAPKGWSQDEWERVDWSFGGGLSIIKDNINIFEDQELSKTVLEDEGWLNPLSMQTQESTIHELVRHPRTCLGLTRDKRFFILVFSGRTKLSKGANYVECSRIAQKMLGEIEYMMNVDGGASSLLALTLNGEFMELSHPAASNNTCTGMARQLNSMLVIEA